MIRERNGHMMAAVLHGPEDLKIERVEIPAVGSEDLLIRVKAALTCGTDFKVFRRGYHARMIVPPAVFGHELAGEIDAIGEGCTIPHSTIPNSHLRTAGVIGSHRLSNTGGEGGPVTVGSHRPSFHGGWSDEGLRVVAANSAPCGECFYCLKGLEELCEDLLFVNGAYAEYITIPERIVGKNLLVIPDHVSFGSAALVEPLACVEQIE